LEADEWLKTVEKMLTITQCADREKVLYASGPLQGTASAWWDAYVAAHATPNAITWQEFTTSFRSYHIPASLMKLKKKVSGILPGTHSRKDEDRLLLEFPCNPTRTRFV
jgi:hypothetical protein